MTETSGARPLDGIRVLEMGQLLAGPFAGALLGYFGAEVIKVEPPGGGDPLRRWRILDEDGTSLWWRSLGRNKKCVTLDLRKPEGRRLARRLVAISDVVIENFRPGTMDGWGLGAEALRAEHPRLIYTSISGYGQTGPYSQRPGFASVCEAVGGLRYVTGFPDGPPVRSNLSLGDSLTGLHAALGILLALLERQRSGTGQQVDAAIYESVFNMLEAVVPEYDRAGVVRRPSGSTITGIVPTNSYPCADGRYVVIGANGDSLFRRLMVCAEREDLGEDPRLADNAGRVEHQEEIDAAIAEWTAGRSSVEVLAALEAARVPAGPIYSVEDMIEDPHYRARGLFEEVEVGDKPLKVPALRPLLARTPGRTEWPGPEVGAHNHEVYGDLLGLSRDEIERLVAEGVL